MSTYNLIHQILTSFATQLPVLLVCLVAGGVILTNWRHAPRSAMWALSGFGLALVLCFVIPISQAAVQYWAMQSGAVAQRTSALTGLSVLWSVLRAATYALLLVAVFAGRSTPEPAPPR